jgi:pimeloyl-ACP methyl ester carboxylesterase
MQIDVMRQLADHLEAAGIASFRYDKRGVGESDGDYRSSGFLDNVADANAALETLRARPEIGQIFVVGHSEGALISTELAGSGADVDGVVLLAGTAKNGKEVLRWQARQLAVRMPRPVKWLLKVLRQDIVRTQAKRFAQLEATTEDVERIQLIRINAKWFREFMDYDPSAALRRIEVPVLALTGSKDIQVDPEDIEAMRLIVGSDFRGEVLPDLTHLLRREDGPPSLRTYKKQARRPVDAALLDRVSDWIAERTLNLNGASHENV